MASDIVSPLTASEARELFSYNHFTGEIRRRIDRPNAKAGDLAGYVDNEGYRRINYNGKKIRAHRLAWLLYYGRWPNNLIDHIDGHRANNRIRNLRDVTVAENQKNMGRPNGRSDGMIGVHLHTPSQKWQADIGVNGRLIYLGLFERQADAIAARKAAEREYGFHQNHGRA